MPISKLHRAEDGTLVRTGSRRLAVCEPTPENVLLCRMIYHKPLQFERKVCYQRCQQTPINEEIDPEQYYHSYGLTACPRNDFTIDEILQGNWQRMIEIPTSLGGTIQLWINVGYVGGLYAATGPASITRTVEGLRLQAWFRVDSPVLQCTTDREWTYELYSCCAPWTMTIVTGRSSQNRWLQAPWWVVLPETAPPGQSCEQAYGPAATYAAKRAASQVQCGMVMLDVLFPGWNPPGTEVQNAAEHFAAWFQQQPWTASGAYTVGDDFERSGYGGLQWWGIAEHWDVVRLLDLLQVYDLAGDVAPQLVVLYGPETRHLTTRRYNCVPPQQPACCNHCENQAQDYGPRPRVCQFEIFPP